MNEKQIKQSVQGMRINKVKEMLIPTDGSNVVNLSLLQKVLHFSTKLLTPNKMWSFICSLQDVILLYTELNDMTLLQFFVSECCDLDIIERFLVKGKVNPNLVNSSCMTALHYCRPSCRNKSVFTSEQKGDIYDFCLVKLLLKYGADVNAQDKHKKTPLIWFICHGFSVDVIQLLLDNGADPNTTDGMRGTALHYCMMYDKLSEPEDTFKILATGPYYFEYPCRPFATEDAEKVIKMLLDKGGNVDARDSHQRTPLLCYLSTFCIRPLKILLEHGADVNTMYEQKMSAIHFVCNYGSKEQLEVLLDYGADVTSTNTTKRTVLMKSLRRCLPFEIIKRLVDSGADPDSKDINLKTPLHCCSSYIDSVVGLKILRLLFDKKVNINATDHRNYTPLMEFVEFNGNPKLIEFLLRNGADPNITNEYKRNALHICCKTPYLTWFRRSASGWDSAKNIIGNLIYYGADVFAEDVNGQIPLDILLCHKNGYTMKIVAPRLLRRMVFIKGCEINSVYFRKLDSIDQTLTAYVRNLEEEVETMKQYMIKENISLYHFCTVTNKRKLGLYYMNSSLTNTASNHLRVLFPSYYLEFVYRKLLTGKIWADVWNKIDRIYITSKTSDKREIVLGTECVRVLSYYLDEKALHNLFIASFDLKAEPEINVENLSSSSSASSSSTTSSQSFSSSEEDL